MHLHQSHGLSRSTDSTNVRGWGLTGQHDDDDFSYAIHHHDGGKYTAHIILHFYPLEQKVHAGGRCTHLLLDPDDVKGFPFELQLANISPAKNHQVITKNIMYIIRVKNKR